jgi:hypothetical protein
MNTTTPSPTLTESDSGEGRRVLSWRLDVLERAGYPAAAAGLLATNSDVDLHQAADLCRCGCPSETALRILL